MTSPTVFIAGGLKVELAEASATSDTSAGNEAAMRAAALAAATYGTWADTVDSYTRDLDQILEDRNGIPSTSSNCINFYDTANVYVQKSKLRFSLAGPKLPVRIVYDVLRIDNGVETTYQSDQEFTLNDSNPQQEVETPLLESTDPDFIETYIGNLRAFFCPYHV